MDKENSPHAAEYYMAFKKVKHHLLPNGPEHLMWAKPGSEVQVPHVPAHSWETELRLRRVW